MAIGKQAHRMLRNLAAAIVTELQESRQEGDGQRLDKRWLSLPIPLSEEETQAVIAAGKGWPHLSLTGDDIERYLGCLRALEPEPELAHLTHDEVDRELGRLVVELWTDRARYRQPQDREQRLDAFLAEVAKPYQGFEVLFVVDGLRLTDATVRFGTATFFQPTEERATAWGITAGPDRWSGQPLGAEIVGRTVGTVTVSSNVPEMAVRRAQEAFDTALNGLRVCVAQFGFRIWDEQLLQRRGLVCVVKPAGSASPVRSTWQPGFGRMDLDLQGNLLTSAEGWTDRLRPLHDGRIRGGLRDQFLRALDWIGSSITREHHDDKVVGLCTALECLLTTRQDERKGEAVALRAMLLGLATDGHFWHPAELLFLYKLRSTVVHGSARGICGEAEYRILRRAAFDLLCQAIGLTLRDKRVTKPMPLFAALEIEQWLDQAIRWLETQPDEHSRAVLTYARARQDGDQPGGASPAALAVGRDDRKPKEIEARP